MIQRIQSIFLLLAAGSAFTLLKLPFATTPQAVKATVFADSAYTISDHIAMMVFFLLAGLLALGSVFLYNNRPLQLKLTRFAIIANILGLVLAVLLFMRGSGGIGEVQIDDGLGVYLPVVFVIFGILALRFIQKDEKLVKSMDRLR